MLVVNWHTEIFGDIQPMIKQELATKLAHLEYQHSEDNRKITNSQYKVKHMSLY
jgi:hypothetical protein